MYKDYENYNSTAKHYDSTRYAYGIDVIIGYMVMLNKNNLKILDIGCGTGNFLVEIKTVTAKNKNLQNLVQEYHGIEPSIGMLNVAKEKNSTIKYQQGMGEELPYEDQKFDIILCTQVLHHLVDNSKSKKYNRVKKALNEMSRVIKNDGLIIINNTSKHQLNSYWYSSLIPNAKKEMLKYLIPNEVIQRAFEKNSATTIAEWTNLESTLSNDYFDENGPLKKKWRDTDSVWALVDENELKEVKKKVTQLINENKMKNHIKREDRKRLKYGQSTFIISKKHD